jgi:hypothetical protein
MSETHVYQIYQISKEQTKKWSIKIYKTPAPSFCGNKNQNKI